MIFSRAPVSETCCKPCASTMARAPPSPAHMRSNTSLAIFDEMTPSSIKATSSAMADEGNGLSSISNPPAVSLAASSLVTQLAVSLASRPSAAASK